MFRAERLVVEAHRANGEWGKLADDVTRAEQITGSLAVKIGLAGTMRARAASGIDPIKRGA